MGRGGGSFFDWSFVCFRFEPVYNSDPYQRNAELKFTLSTLQWTFWLAIGAIATHLLFSVLWIKSVGRHPILTESLLKTGEAFRRIDIGDETVQTNAIAYAEQVSVDPLIIDDAEPSMESGIMPLGSDDDFYWPITDDFKNLSISYNGKTHNGMHDHCTPTAATGIFRYLTHLGKTSCTSGESTNKTFEKLYISLNTNNISFSSFCFCWYCEKPDRCWA